MEIIAIYNNEKVTEEEVSSFHHRLAVRGVIIDNENKVALLHIESRGYYNLPGGGVEKDENPRQAMIRECKEEIGCNIKITTELGKSLEYRKQNHILNKSYGYIGTIIGEKNEPLLIGDENESEKNATIVWVPLETAIELMEKTAMPEQLYSQYILARDLTFLKKAQVSIR